jgi:hypothetical protein
MFDRGYQVAGELARNVYERVRPLPGRLVIPLQKYEGEGEPESAKEAAEPPVETNAPEEKDVPEMPAEEVSQPEVAAEPEAATEDFRPEPF